MRDRWTLKRLNPLSTVASLLLPLLLLLGDERISACSGLQFQPLESYTSGEECALILNGPGRTSVYDYTYNLLRGNFPPSVGNSQTCITYEAVNRAYLEARKRINVAQPKTEKWRPEDLATVGELLLDISRNLAQTYGLTTEEIEKSLPLIDTSKTLINEVCPAFLSNVECRPGKYRRYDGLCTNLQNPTWGASLSPFTRLLPPRFADGLSAPRISVTGQDLPLSRVVSRTMHPDEGYHDHAGTVMVIAWGQFMDHDYTLTGTPLDPLNRNDPEECCSRPAHLRNPYCNEIVIPEDDYFYRLFNVKCIDFVRAFPAVRPGCRLGSRVPFNLLTGVLDGNTVYGISDEFSRKLRTGYGGLLRMNPVFAEYGLKDLLPLKLDIPDEGCTRPNRSMYCFEAGEIRVNEQLVLTCMHTLMAREHNRVANGLAQVNPHWDDETLFQEARRIIIAQIQHVTYNEFLPILLGKDVMEKFGLLLEKESYWDGYDPSINPGVIDAFASAAFRFGHSLLPTAVERWSKAHKFIASKRLSDLIRRPYDLYRAGVLDEYFMGLMNQVAQAMDDSITQEVTNHLFKKVGAKFGMDLVSFNMQRGREFGIPSYMEFRKFCGLPGADSFEELFGSMPNETIRRYSSIFLHPSDVDLWSGGVSERPLPGSMLGPTFACVIATQFSYSRRGDRFWYELPNQPSSFTPEQLKEIKKTKLAKLICDNTDLIDTIQIYPMVLPDHEINPRVPCRSGVLPSMDFSKWAEFPAGAGRSTAQYNTIKKDSSAANPVLGSKDGYTEKKLTSMFPAFSKKSKTWPFEIPALKKFFPSIHRRVIERKIVLQNIEIDTEEPDEVTKLSTIIELIREKNKKRELKKRENKKRKANKKVQMATSGQKTKDKITKAIIKKSQKSNIEKNLGNSKNSLDSSRVSQEIPRLDSTRGIVDQIIERARLLGFLENLYRQSFPEEVVRKILDKYTAKDLVEKSHEVSIGKVKNKIGNTEKLEKDKMINVMIINSKDYKNVEQQKSRAKRSTENAPADLESNLTLEKLYRQSFPEEVVRKIIEKYSGKDQLKKATDIKTEEQIVNPEEPGKNKTENLLKDFSEAQESSGQNSLKIHVKRAARKKPVNSTTASTADPEIPTQDKNAKVPVEGLYRHPRLTYEDQRDALPEILSTNPPILPRFQLQITTARPNLLYQRIWDIINDTRSGWPDKDSYKVTNKNVSTLKNVESQRLEKPYVPVLADCKDAKEATASEVADLTAPSKKLLSVEPKKAEVDDKPAPGIPGYTTGLPSSEKLKDFIPSPRQSEALTWKPINVLDKKDIYANLQDHQSTTARNVPTYPLDIPPYNPDKIPYVDVPDYSDRREESLDKDEPVRKLKEEPDVIDPTEVDDAKLVKGSDEVDDEEGNGKVLNRNKSSGPRVDKPAKLSGDEKTPRRRSDDAEEDKEPEESGKVQKEETAEDFEVHFDINEYRKPFNFEEFLKNDPIFKELRNARDDEEDDKAEEKEETKEERPKQKLRNKEIPVHEEEKKEDYTDPEEYKGSAESESSEKEDYHKPSANENYSSVDHGNYTGDSKEDLEERVTEDEFRYGDKNFFKPIFGKKTRSADNVEDKGEDEFVSRYFSDDVKRKLSQTLNEEKKGKRRELDEAEDQKNIYKRLTTITDKRGEEEGAGDDDKSTPKYNKYWVLEYGFPRKRGAGNSNEDEKH